MKYAYISHAHKSLLHYRYTACLQQLYSDVRTKIGTYSTCISLKTIQSTQFILQHKLRMFETFAGKRLNSRASCVSIGIHGNCCFLLMGEVGMCVPQFTCLSTPSLQKCRHSCECDFTWSYSTVRCESFKTTRQWESAFAVQRYRNTWLI